MYKILLILLTMIAATGCKSHSASEKAESNNFFTTIPAKEPSNAVVTAPIASVMPAAIVYKTRADYSDKVPINLNADKTSIMSYPDPHDIHAQSSPLPLADGYLLDRRGISTNVAFTSFTYEQYAALTHVPSTATLFDSIIDKSPLTEMYRLPININQAVADTARVNQYIRSHFTGCTPLLMPSNYNK